MRQLKQLESSRRADITGRHEVGNSKVPIAVSLLTGGDDKSYAVGLTLALVAHGRDGGLYRQRPGRQPGVA